MSAVQRNAVIENPNDSDFQSSSNSASDLSDILDSQEEEDLASGLQEVFDSPPKPAASSSKKKKKKPSKKNTYIWYHLCYKFTIGISTLFKNKVKD